MEKKGKITQVYIFKELWIHSVKKSFISGISLSKYIGGYKEFNIFAHVLSKKQYPYFRLYIGCIRLLTPFEHHLIDHSTEERRDDYKKECAKKSILVRWDKWYKAEEMLKKLYDEKFPEKKDGIIMKYSEEEVMETIIEMNREWFIKNGK